MCLRFIWRFFSPQHFPFVPVKLKNTVPQMQIYMYMYEYVYKYILFEQDPGTGPSAGWLTCPPRDKRGIPGTSPH